MFPFRTHACIKGKAGELVRVTKFRFFMTIYHAKLRRLIETGVISLTLESTGVVKIIGDISVQSTRQQKTLLLPTKSHGTPSILYQMQHKAWLRPHSSQQLAPWPAFGSLYADAQQSAASIETEMVGANRARIVTPQDD
jgi:hypothetical protein